MADNVVEFSIEVVDKLENTLLKNVKKVEDLGHKIKGIKFPSFSKLGGEALHEGIKGILSSATGFSSLQDVVQGVFSVGKEAVQAFTDQELSVSKLKEAIHGTGDAAKKQLSELIGKAEEMAGKTLFSTANINNAQSLLSSMKNVKGAIYDQAMPAILDMSTKLHTSLDNATKIVGKALENPKNAIGELAKAGINLTDKQKDLIKHFQSIGDSGKAQAVILDALKGKFGGAAEAAANAGLGPLEKLKHKFEPMLQDLGGKIIEIIKKIGDFINKIVDWIKTHSTEIKNALNAIEAPLNVVKTVLGFVATAVWEVLKVGFKLLSWIGSSKTAMTLFGIAIVALAGYLGYMKYQTQITAIAEAGLEVVTTILSTSFAVLNAIMSLNPIAIVVLAVAALIAVFVYLWNNVEEGRGVLMGLWNAVSNIFKRIYDLGAAVFTGIGMMIKGAFHLDWGEIEAGANKIGSAFSDFGKGVAGDFNSGYKEGVKSYQDDQKKNNAPGVANGPKTDLPSGLDDNLVIDPNGKTNKGGQQGDAKGNPNGHTSKGTGAKNSDRSNPASLGSNVSQVSSSRPSSVHITIHKFNGVEHMHANGLKETMKKVKDHGSRAAVNLLNDLNRYATAH